MSVRDLPRTIGFWGAIGVMIGVTIGSGIFRAPASIANESGSPLLILALWGVGGLICLMGALTYTELAVVFPRSGGLYNFLYQGFGPRISFVFGWTYMLLTKPFAAGGIAVVFAEHLDPLIHLQARANALVGPDLAAHLQHRLGDQWTMPLLVCAVLFILTWINTLGMRAGSGISLALTIAKYLALAAIVALAIALKKGSAENFAPASIGKPLSLALAPIMAAILWTYDGWSDVGSIAGEIKDPQRTLPRVYIIGTAATILLYVAVNAAYIWLLPLSEMRSTQNVAPLVMQRLIGPSGGLLVSIIIMVSTLGSTHASIITGARVTFAQAQDGLLFRFLGEIHPRHQTPAVALWMQLALSCVAVLFLRSFDQLAGGFVFTMWIFYGLAAIAVIRLRFTRPDLPRSFRCPGFPLVPAAFALVAAGMTAMTIISGLIGEKNADGQIVRDYMPLIWLVVLAAGWPAYSLWQRAVPPTSPSAIN
jgi:APA family basic amino acid/polyamine antiporter